MIIKFKLTNPRTEYISIASTFYESYQMYITKNRYPERNGDVWDINIVTSGTTRLNMPGFKTEEEAQHVLDEIANCLRHYESAIWLDVDAELRKYNRAML